LRRDSSRNVGVRPQQTSITINLEEITSILEETTAKSNRNYHRIKEETTTVIEENQQPSLH